MKKKDNTENLLKSIKEAAGIWKHQKYDVDKFIRELRKSKRIDIKRRILK